MADDVRIDSLSIEIESNVKPAAQSINSLASAVKKYNDEVAKGKGFGEIVNLANSAKTAADNMKDAPARLRELADALRVLGQASKGVKFSKELAATLSDIGVAAKGISANVGQRLNSLAAGLTAIRDVGDVRISPTIGSGITAINDAIAGINVNNLSRIGRFVESVQQLRGVGDVNISNSIAREMQNIAFAADLLGDANLEPIAQLGTVLSTFGDVGNIRIPANLADRIVNLGVAADLTRDTDWSTFERMSAGLRSLEGLGEIRIPRIRGVANNNVGNNGTNNQALDATADGFVGVSDAAERANSNVEGFAHGMGDAENAANRVGQAFANVARQFGHGFVGGAGLTNVVRQMQEIFSSPANAIGYGIGAAINTAVSAVGRLAGAFRDIGIKAFTTSVNILQSALRGLGSAAALAGKAILTFGKTGLKALAGVAKIEFKGLMALPRLFGESLIKRIKSVASSINGFVRSIGRIAFYRMIRTAIKEVTKAFSEGIKNLYQWSLLVDHTFANSMDKIATSMLYLKNSLGAAVAPIINTLAPAIDFVVDKFVDAINVVNQFLAAITGSQTYTAAKKLATEWAENETEKANKNLKDLKKTILGFDELNVLNGNKNNNNNNGNNDVADYRNMFETRNVESSISEFAQKIRNAFNSGDWAGIGNIFAEKINGWINDTDWYGLGNLLGDKINIVINSMLGFVRGFQWGDAGTAFATSVTGLIDEVDWENLGSLFGESITGLATWVKNAAENFPWVSVGENLATFANEMFSAVDWGEVADGLIGVLNGAFDSLYTFIRDFKWTKHGEELKKGILKFVNKFPFDKAAQVLKGAFAGVLKSMIPTLSDTELMEKIGGKLANFLNKIFDNSNSFWDTVGTSGNALIVSVLTVGQQFVEDFDEIQAASSIKAALEKIHWGEIATSTWELITSALSKAGSFVDALFSKSVRGLYGTERQQVIAFNMKPLGTRIADSLKDVIGRVPWDNIAKTTWESVKNGFKVSYDFVSAMFGLDENTAADTDKKIRKIGESIGGELQKIPWSSIASDVWSKIKTAFSHAGNFVDALLNEDVDSARSIDEAYERLKFNNQSFGTKLGTRISQAIAGINWKQFGTDLSTGATNLFNNFADALNKLTERDDALGMSKLQYAVQQFASGVDWKALTESMASAAHAAFVALGQTLGQAMMSGISSILTGVDPYKENMSATDLGTLEALVGGAGQAFGGFNPESKDKTGKANSWVSKGKTLASSIVAGAVNELDASQSVLSTAFKNVFVDPYMVEVEGQEGFDVGSPSKRTEKLGNNVMQGFLNGVKPMWLQFLSAVSQGVQNFVTLVLQPLNNLVTIGIPGKMTTATTAFQTGWSNIQITTSTGVQGVVTLTLTALKNVADVGIPNQFKAFNSGFQTGWSDINNTTRKAMGTFYSIIRSDMDSLDSYLPSKFKSIFNEIVGYTNSLINKVESACNSVINGLNRVLTIHLEWTKPDWAGGGTYWWNWNANIPNVDFSNVSYLANGGILKSPTWLTPNAIGGEAGYEAVLPLDTHTEWMNDIADRVVAAANNSYYASGAGEREGSGYDNSREIELLREQNNLLRQLINKDTTVEITTGQIARANVRQNRRAGTTIIPVGT